MDSKQVKKNHMSPDEFTASVFGLASHRPPPIISVSLALKSGSIAHGDYAAFYEALYDLCGEHSISLVTTVKGEWMPDAEAQMILFAPPDEEEEYETTVEMVKPTGLTPLSRVL